MAGVGDFSWLTVSYPTHVESRTDQYIAAFRYASDAGVIATAYVVRAVTPGTFVLPGATVEDMYRPEFRANTDASTIVIAPAGSPVVSSGGEAPDRLRTPSPKPRRTRATAPSLSTRPPMPSSPARSRDWPTARSGRCG